MNKWLFGIKLLLHSPKDIKQGGGREEGWEGGREEERKRGGEREKNGNNSY